ncbi:MAG: ribonuclease H-like domain-containing protein, partial [Candidatus Hydrogenedentes bacterium]|nr:ribonuclease H-like domain-containing protein [Candidatus Hydrogenedentota bacterium]
RFIQNRKKFPLEKTAHYDLVHAARRVWKKRLRNCSLNNIEKEVLGLKRQGDVPGYLIPQLWLHYLDTGDARPLAPVFYHHEMDILSLAALTGYLAKRLAADSNTTFHHAEDRLAIVRLYVKNKDYESAITEAQRFLENPQEGNELRRECLTLLGQSYKRTELFEEMVAAWLLLHEEFPGNIYAAAELAKYREHQERNYGDAIKICEKTLAHIAANPLPEDFSVSALRGRLLRLEKKQARLRARSKNEDPDFPE